MVPPTRWTLFAIWTVNLFRKSLDICDGSTVPTQMMTGVEDSKTGPQNLFIPVSDLTRSAKEAAIARSTREVATIAEIFQRKGTVRLRVSYVPVFGSIDGEDSGNMTIAGVSFSGRRKWAT